MNGTTEFQRKIAALSAAGEHHPPEAYEFVSDSVRETVVRLGEVRHVTAAELLNVFKARLTESFGPMAPAVLREWRIADASDVGRIVYELIGIQLLSASPDDRESDFDIPFDLTDPPPAATAENSWKGPKID